MLIRKKMFRYTGPKEFFADDLAHAEELMYMELEEVEEEGRPLTAEEKEDLKADEAYQTHKERDF